MAKALADKGPQGVVLTGIHRDSCIGNPFTITPDVVGQDEKSATGTRRLYGHRLGVRCRGEASKPYKRRQTSSARSWNMRNLDLPHNAGLAFEEYLTLQ